MNERLALVAFLALLALLLSRMVRQTRAAIASTVEGEDDLLTPAELSQAGNATSAWAASGLAVHSPGSKR
jgi:hypothetical protein